MKVNAKVTFFVPLGFGASVQPLCGCGGVTSAESSGIRLHLPCELLVLCFYYDIFTAFSVSSVSLSCSGFDLCSGLQSRFAHHLMLCAESRALESIGCSYIWEGLTSS